MKRIPCDQKGMALILTIMIISLLVVVIVQFGLGMRREYLSAANLKDTAVADGIAISGVNIAMELLAWDGRTTGSDSFHNVWHKIAGRDVSSLFTQGALHLRISDLSGRLQINSLVSDGKGKEGADVKTARKSREILKRLLLSGTFGEIGEEQAQGIIDSLVDWIDPDDRESPYGAENGYYRSLNPPYDCRNGPVAFMEELLLVKGMSREILYGTRDHGGLAPYITVHGNDGRININTADPVLLQAMDDNMSEELAHDMVEYRADEKNTPNLSSPTWYKNIPEWPSGLGFDQKTIATKSRYFVITSVGESGSLTEKEEVIVHRESDNKISFLSRKVD